MAKSSESKACAFCKMARGEIKTEKIVESNNFFAVFDMRPKINGHALIIPKKHFITLLDIPNNLGNEMLEFTKKVAGMLLDEKYGDGFNVLMNNLAVAGQYVMHAHLHILPRKEGDGLRVIG